MNLIKYCQPRVNFVKCENDNVVADSDSVLKLYFNQLLNL